MKDVRSLLIAFMAKRGVRAQMAGNRRYFRGLLDDSMRLSVEDDPLRWPGSAWLNISLGFLPYAPEKRWQETENLLRRNMALIHQFHAGIITGPEGEISLVWRAAPELMSEALFNRKLAQLFSLAKALHKELGETQKMPAPDAGMVQYL